MFDANGLATLGEGLAERMEQIGLERGLEPSLHRLEVKQSGEAGEKWQGEPGRFYAILEVSFEDSDDLVMERIEIIDVTRWR